MVFVVNKSAPINSIDDFINNTNITGNRKEILSAFQPNTKATLKGNNAQKYFGKQNAEVNIKDIEIYTIDADGNPVRNEVGVEVSNARARFIAKSGAELKAFLNSISDLPTGVSYTGKMYRYIPVKYANNSSNAKTIIQTATSDVDNRFKTGLYLSETKSGNIIEASSYDGTSGKQLYEFTNIKVNNLLDLTDVKKIEQLGTSLGDLKLIDVDNKYEFTHAVAEWAKNNGYSGIKFYGTQGGTTKYINFVLFQQSVVDNAIKAPINPISW